MTTKCKAMIKLILIVLIYLGALQSMFAQSEFWEQIRYFHQSEFYGGGHEINRQLVQYIDEVRHQYGKPIYINSGVRSIAHNNHIKGASNSLHIKGAAIDLSATQGPQRYELLWYLMKVSEEWDIPIKVIVYRRHIHIALWKERYLTVRE